MDSVLKVLLLEESESDALLIAQALQTASLSSDVRRVENLPELVREPLGPGGRHVPEAPVRHQLGHELAGGEHVLDPL